jgi:serine/threonine protein kinase
MNPPGAAQLPNDAGEPAEEREHPRTTTVAGPLPAKAPTVPDYELLRRIGGGAYGEVWLARSKATGALRAAKIVWRARFEDERPYRREFEGIQRFEKISREHPSQLALFHIGRNDAEGYFYYVMELADDLNAKSAVVGNPKPESPGGRPPNPKEVRNPKSETSATEGKGRASDSGPASATGIQDSDTYVPHILRADLSDGPLPAARVLEVGLALSEALAHLHQHGLIHRDVKPSNVIFVNGRPKLADIGLVTDASDQCSIVGTEGYLPPEGPGTPQADIFALGKVLYEAATGLDRREFPKLPADLRDWPDTRLVVELNEIVLRACSKHAVHRYKSAQEVLEDLGRLGKGRSVMRHRVWNRRLRVVRSVGFVTAAIVLAAGGGVFLWRTAQQRGAPVVLVGDVSEVLSSHNTEAIAAYRLGLSGLRRYTPEGCRSAIDNFGQAIELDPKFVNAYARLIETYALSQDHGLVNGGGTIDKLGELAARLHKIAETNAETHAAVAIALYLNEWKWDDSEKEFKKALEKDPHCRMALTFYGYFLTRLLRPEQAEVFLKRAQEVDPLSPVIAEFLGHCEYARRDFEQAMYRYVAVTQLDPEFASAHYWAARASMALTNYFIALPHLRTHEELQGGGAEVATRYEKFQKSLEKEKDPEHQARAYWSSLIDEQKQHESNTPPYIVARRYAFLGDKEQALTWLERACARHNEMENLLFDEFWDPYRKNPRFRRVLKTVGLERWQR